MPEEVGASFLSVDFEPGCGELEDGGPEQLGHMIAELVKGETERRAAGDGKHTVFECSKCQLIRKIMSHKY